MGGDAVQLGCSTMVDKNRSQESDSRGDWKTLATKWLVSQSVPTVLLCAILAFLGYVFVYLVPAHLRAIQDGYERNAASLEKSVDKLVSSHEKDRTLWFELIHSRVGEKTRQE